MVNPTKTNRASHIRSLCPRRGTLPFDAGSGTMAMVAKKDENDDNDGGHRGFRLGLPFGGDWGHCVLTGTSMLMLT